MPTNNSLNFELPIIPWKLAMQLGFPNPAVDSGSLTYREKDSPQIHPRIHDRVCYGTATTLLI